MNTVGTVWKKGSGREQTTANARESVKAGQCE
jgi:hypothetical protein